MDRHESAQEGTLSLLHKVIILIVFVTVMTSFIFYFNQNTPDYKRAAMQNLAEQFSTSVTNAHWQWQAEGRPQIVMLVHYEPRLGDENTLVEKDRRPIVMSHLGWPRSEPTSEGCAKLWQMVLSMPLEVEGFKVYAEYFDGVDLSDNALDAKCRFRLSVGPYFEYLVYTGQVSKVED